MKRLLIFCNLIILCLMVTPLTTYADPDGFTNYIPFFNDGSVIDEDLNNFPATVKLSSSSGKLNRNLTAVFSELSDANRKKIAITASDKSTQAYVEIEKWSTADQEAILHYSFGTTFTDYESSKQSSTLWLSEDRAAHYNGFTYKVYMDFTAGGIYIKKFSHTDRFWTTAVQIVGSISANAHKAPIVCVDDDGYIFVAYGSYVADGGVYVYKSTNPEDISAWNTVETAATGTYSYFSYPNLIQLSNKDIVCFYRARNGSTEWSLQRVVRSNSTGTWGTPQLIVESNAANDRPYFDIAEANDRVHIGYHVNDDSESALAHDLYYVYADQVSGGTTIASPTWYSADATSATLPVYEWGTALVFDSDAAWDSLYITAVGCDNSDNPYIVAGVTDSANTDKLLFFSYSSGWASTTVIEDNGVTWDLDGQNVSDGDINIVSSTNYEVLFCQKVGSYTEIKEYETTNSGTTWTKKRDVTTGSTTNWQSVCYPYNFNDQCRYIAWNGATYDHDYGKDIYYGGSATDYQMVHVGYDIRFLWYDADASDNTTYVGDPTDAVTHNVYSGYTGVWHMGGTTCYDSTSNANDLTDNGPVQTTGQLGYGQDFVRAESDYLSVSGVTMPNPGSIEFWWTPDNSEELNQKETLFSFDPGSSNYWLIHKRADHGTASFDNTFGLQQNDGSDSTYKYITGANGWVQGETHHCMLVWLSFPTPMAYMYIDGTLQSWYYDLYASNVPTGSGTFVVGGQSLNSSLSDYYDGMIDEVKLSASARSSTWANVSALSGSDDLFYFTAPESVNSVGQVIIFSY